MFSNCQKNVEKIDLKAIAIVRNPMDKYCVLTPQGIDWNYTMVEMVINKMITPYEEIRVEKNIKTTIQKFRKK